MKNLITRTAIVSALIALLSAAFAMPSRGAGGSYLYWGTTPVKTASLSVCYDFASDAMRQQNFQNIRRSGNEVAGSKGGVYTAVTCLGTAPRATAVVMATGGDAQQTARVRDELRNLVARIIRFD